MSKPGLLTLTIKDKSALYLAYMPFIKNGGLFIPTNSSYKLGDEVFMLRWYATSIRHMDQEGAEWLRVQKLANFVDLHGHDDATAGTDDKPCHLRRIYLALVCSNYVACESAVQLTMCARSEHRPDRGNTAGSRS